MGDSIMYHDPELAKPKIVKPAKKAAPEVAAQPAQEPVVQAYAEPTSKPKAPLESDAPPLKRSKKLLLSCSVSAVIELRSLT